MKKTYRISIFNAKRGRITLPTRYTSRSVAQAEANRINREDLTHLLGAEVQEEK